jgi:hypothetical protein
MSQLSDCAVLATTPPVLLSPIHWYCVVVVTMYAFVHAIWLEHVVKHWQTNGVKGLLRELVVWNTKAEGNTALAYWYPPNIVEEN